MRMLSPKIAGVDEKTIFTVPLRNSGRGTMDIYSYYWKTLKIHNNDILKINIVTWVCNCANSQRLLKEGELHSPFSFPIWLLLLLGMSQSPKRGWGATTPQSGDFLTSHI